jgi:hypothetical protein
LKKTTELKFLRDFQDEIKVVNCRLQNFNKDENLQDDFIRALICCFCNTKDLLNELRYEIGINFEGLFEFLLETSNKLKLEKDKEFYWTVVSFIFYNIKELNGLTTTSLSDSFNPDDVIKLFSLLGTNIEIFSDKLKLFLGNKKVPNFFTVPEHQIFYSIKNRKDDSKETTFSWSETPDLKYNSFISSPGNIVILDEGLFNLYEYNNISKDNLDSLNAKFLRLFASNYMYCSENESKEFFEAKSSIKNDKLLSKCFTETMNRNLSRVALGSEKDINLAYAKGKIPLYKELEKYICESAAEIFLTNI